MLYNKHTPSMNTFLKRVVVLTIFVGTLPFLFSRAYADESPVAQETAQVENRWLDDYSQPVGFTYGAQAVLNANYLWRGLYAGGLSFQPSASVGYGGLYAFLWWSVGTTDWNFRAFQPEMDFEIGFARWGLDVFVLYIHNFDCGFFDFSNYAGKGNRLEIDVRYTISSKLPLSFLWATRIGAADGYIDAAGELKQAYSSYAEISYTQRFAYDISLYGAVGITPWRSCYTHYMMGFAVPNIELRLRKDWSLSTHCGLMLQGTLAVNPSGLAADLSSAEWHPGNPGAQTVNANIGVGVYLK